MTLVSEMTSDTRAFLRVDALGKDFAGASGPVRAVGCVDFELRAGEFVAVLGPSGCGKTTLLRMIGALEPPTRGEVVVDGVSLWRDPAASEVTKRLAFAFQDSRLFPWFSIEENIALPLRVRGVAKPKRLARARDLCRLVGLDGFEAARPRELSGGMRQRASLARALVTEPRLILLDEPCGALDAMTRDQMNLELQRICMTTGASAVLITHSIPEAVFLADRVVVLTPRPSRVQAIHDVPIPRPRTIATQETPEFQAIVRAIRTDIADYPA